MRGHVPHFPHLVVATGPTIQSSVRAAVSEMFRVKAAFTVEVVQVRTVVTLSRLWVLALTDLETYAGWIV